MEDDATARVIERLLAPNAEGRERLEEYRGTGDLRSFVRVAAARREALSQVDLTLSRILPPTDDADDDAIENGRDPR